MGQQDDIIKRICLHPSVGTWAKADGMTPRQKVAAVAKVRCLEHSLFEGDRIRRELDRHAAEEIVAKINELRRALGWLEMDFDFDGHRLGQRGGAADTRSAGETRTPLTQPR